MTCNSCFEAIVYITLFFRGRGVEAVGKISGGAMLKAFSLNYGKASTPNT